MSTRRLPSWPRGGLHVRGRRKRAKLSLAKHANAMKTSLRKKLRELQRTIPGSQGMDPQTLLQNIEKYIILLEAKVRILRCLSTLYGV